MSGHKIDILAFGAHPDDVELGCGGTLIKHVRKGLKIGIIDLTRGELGTRGNMQERSSEAETSAKKMGVCFRENLNLPDGFFEDTKSAKLAVIESIRRYRPEIIITNALADRHPDHGRAAQLVRESAFLSGLPKIQLSKNGIPFQAWRPRAVYHYIQDDYSKPDFVVDITDCIEEKFAAIKSFKSQFFNPHAKGQETPISTPEFLHILKGRCMDFGRMTGVQYGEGFTVNRPVGIISLNDLH